MHLSRVVHLGHRTVLIHTFDIRVIVLTIQFLPGLLLPLLYGWYFVEGKVTMATPRHWFCPTMSHALLDVAPALIL